MIFVYKDIYVDQGASFTQQFLVKTESGSPVDLSNHTGLTIVIRHYHGSTEGISAEATIANAELGVLTVLISPQETQKLTYSRGVYSIKINTPNGLTLVLYSGQVIISENA